MFETMRNRAMARKLLKGDAVDVSKCQRVEILEGVRDVYKLQTFVDDVDYCDSVREAWIWSIGRNAAGEVYASTGGGFYQKPGWECLWLR